MQHAMSRLDALIAQELRDPRGSSNGEFASALNQPVRYERFLRIIVDRHRTLREEFKATVARELELSRQHRRPDGSRRAMTSEEVQLSDRQFVLSSHIHLEIESFYLFAKILLDKLAHVVEHGFGAVRGLSLDSHDSWTRNFTRYLEAKNLDVPAELELELKSLKRRIADFRDYQIAHEKSPRRMRGVVWNSDQEPRMLLTRMNPRERELNDQKESESIGSLMTAINMYIDRLCDLIEANREKTRFELEG